MKKIKITESQYRRLITEEEGASMHPEILKNKTLINVNMAIRLEKVFRELINDEITRADTSLLSRIFPIDKVVDKVVEVYVKYVPRIIDSGFFECEVDEGAISKLLKEFLIELGGIMYKFIDDIGFVKSKAIATYISTTGINLEKGMKQNEYDVKIKMSEIIDKMFFTFPKLNFHLAVRDSIKPYKGMGCNITKNKKGWWGSFTQLYDIKFFPKVHTKIINKLTF
tara:strand:+ start:1696 stop:2370 length:675 start_codon:yes stop_codon:yes gene_type:complete